MTIEDMIVPQKHLCVNTVCRHTLTVVVCVSTDSDLDFCVSRSYLIVTSFTDPYSSKYSLSFSEGGGRGQLE